MSLFFFIAAYFTPPSIDRKGGFAFLVDRFKRLGIPCVLYFFLVSPALTAFVDATVTGREPTWIPGAGPPWFVAWLLIFSVAYSLLGTKGYSGAQNANFVMARPNIVILCIIGAALGVLQGVQLLFPLFVYMPITFGSLPFDVAFFTAGIIARRNSWLDMPLLPWESRIAKVVCATFAIALTAALLAIESQGGGMLLLSTNACGDSPSRSLSGSSFNAAVAFTGVVCVAGGVYAVCISLVLIDWFRAHCEARGRWSSFLAQNAYAVYVMHPIVVIPATAAFIVVIRVAKGDGAMRTWGDINGIPVVDSVDCVSTNGYDAPVLLAGLLVASVTSLVVIYPLAHIVRRLPGLSQIL